MAKKNTGTETPADTTVETAVATPTANPKSHAGNRLVLTLAKAARIGNGDRKAGTVIGYVTAADDATLGECAQLINNPQLQKVTREDAK